MKELYIAPEMEIMCFAPMEKLANGFDISWQSYQNFSRLDSGVSAGGDLRDDDIEVTLPGGNVDPLD